MIESFQVHQLVNQHVIADGGRHQDEPPVQRNVAVAATGAPPGSLIADAHPGDRQSMLRRHLEQPRWQLDARALAQGCSLVRAKC